MEELREKLLYQETLDLDDGDVRDVLMDLVYRETPMKVTGRKFTYPNEYGVTMVEVECPNCEISIEFESLRCYEPEYCDECGQKLDWED